MVTDPGIPYIFIYIMLIPVIAFSPGAGKYAGS